jgi:hypothetical protein
MNVQNELYISRATVYNDGMHTFSRYCTVASILFVLLTISAEQGDSTIESGSVARLLPDSLSRPQKGEATRYPQDLIIGELGHGEVPEEAYFYAKMILGGFLGQSQEVEVLVGDIWQRTKDAVDVIAPQKFRLGGGRQETDGGVSFIFRFIGREQWLTGEIYVRFQDAIPTLMQEEGGAAEEDAVPAEIEYTRAGWQVDDILLDDPKRIGESGTVYQYDFSPYERFF